VRGLRSRRGSICCEIVAMRLGALSPAALHDCAIGSCDYPCLFHPVNEMGMHCACDMCLEENGVPTLVILHTHLLIKYWCCPSKCAFCVLPNLPFPSRCDGVGRSRASKFVFLNRFGDQSSRWLMQVVISAVKLARTLAPGLAQCECGLQSGVRACRRIYWDGMMRQPSERRRATRMPPGHSRMCDH
jgi:hypothetical protein